KHGVAVVGLTNSHHIGRIGHWAEQCARAGLVSTHWVNVHGHKSLVAPFGGAEPRFTIGTISVACALGYLDYRFAAMDWRAKHPKLAKWFNSTAKTPAMKATPP